MRMILYQNRPLYSSLTNYTKISMGFPCRETPCSVKLKRRGNFILRMRTIWLAQAVQLKIGATSINEMKGDVGMLDQQKMIETRHGLESNPVPTSILSFIAIIAPWGAKMDVGTGLNSKPCLVSIIFADLTSLHPPSFH